MGRLSGTGRTELAQASFGVMTPESGTVEVEVQEVKISRPEDAMELGIAYVPEDRQRQGLITAMTVGENIGMTRLGALKKGPFIDFKTEDALPREYIDKLRIKTPHSPQVARNLSGGNPQKIVVGKW